MKVIPLTIGPWNVGTLMDSSSSDRPKRKTALVGRVLDRYKVETAALSETRLAEEGLSKDCKKKQKQKKKKKKKHRAGCHTGLFQSGPTLFA